MKAIPKGEFMIYMVPQQEGKITFQLQEKKDFLCSFMQHDRWRIQLLQLSWLRFGTA